MKKAIFNSYVKLPEGKNNLALSLAELFERAMETEEQRLGFIGWNTGEQILHQQHLPVFVGSFWR
jgi:hypothetical protein